MAYPLLQVGFWAAMIALFLVVLRVPSRRSVRGGSALIAAACALAAVLCVLVAAPAALAGLAGLPVSFRLTGAMLGWLSTAAATASGVLQLSAD